MTIPLDVLRTINSADHAGLAAGTYTATDNRPHEVVSVHVTMSGDSQPGAVEAMVAKEMIDCMQRFDRQSVVAHGLPFARILP